MQPGRCHGAAFLDPFLDEDLQVFICRKRCIGHRVYDFLLSFREDGVKPVAVDSPNYCVGSDVKGSGAGFPFTTAEVGHPEGRFPGLHSGTRVGTTFSGQVDLLVG
jgi:hypothetical protein